jgi:hypothetical protein
MSSKAIVLTGLIFSFSLLFLFNRATAQMSGTFTIGGVNPDFEGFYEAIDSVQSGGVSGNVVFNVRPGNYPGFNIGTIPVVGANDTITFQAETLDSASVVITGAVYLTSTSNVTFKHLTIRPFQGQTYTCITLDKSDKILFSHCRIEKTDNVDFSLDDALISIIFEWIGNIKSVKFSHSVIASEFHTVLINGVKGKVNFEFNTFTGGIRDMYGHPVKNYLYNTLYFNEGSMDIMNQYFEGNEVYLNDQWAWLSVRGNCNKNVFHCPVHIEGNQIHGNNFKENVNFSYGTLSMVDNVVEKDIFVIYCHNSSFIFNKFYGNCIFSSDNQKVISNFFYGNVKFTQGPNQQIYHNNFGVSSKLEVIWCSAIIKNNILISDTITQPSVTEMVNNNFIPCPACQLTMTGVDASYYDAMYVSASDLHATNPILTRKAISIPGYYINHDIDSTLRKSIASMGANEICLNFPVDQIEQRCNDSLCLDACMPDFTGYYWTPSFLFPDSTAGAPVIHLETPSFVYLNRTGIGIVDSLYIKVIRSTPFANQSYTANLLTVHYNNLSWCAESVRWEFGDNTSSSEWEPTHTFPGSGIFHSKLIAYNQLGSDTCIFDTQILIESLDQLPETEINLYPNPATSELFIDLNPLKDKCFLTVYNNIGQVVYISSFESHAERIDLSGFDPGIYLFRFQTGNRSTIKKIILQ